MEHRHLGRTGVSVSPLCLGTMMLGAWGEPDHDESVRIIHAALDAGITFIDTADVSSAGESEEILARGIENASSMPRSSSARSPTRRPDAHPPGARLRAQPPAVTAPIIGPRTMAHLESQLAAADVVLTADVLDRIDEIVPPGTNLNTADGGWRNPSLEPAARRR